MVVTMGDRSSLSTLFFKVVLATHSGAHAATMQKIHALAGRPEPQARDVFDLSLLFARADAEGLSLTEAERGVVPDAVDRAMSVSFDDYVSKVVAYLLPEQAELFAGRDVWNAMQEEVVARLESLR